MNTGRFSTTLTWLAPARNPELVRGAAMVVITLLLTISVLQWPIAALLLVICSGFVLLLCWRPMLVLALYPILLLSAPALLRGVPLFNIGLRIDQLLLLLAALLVFGLMLVLQRPLPVNQVLIAYGLYITSFLVSTLFSKFALGYEFGSYDILQLLGQLRGLAILFVFILLVRNVRRASLVTGVLLSTGTAVVAFGLGQLAGVGWVRALTLLLYFRKYALESWLLFQRVTGVFDGLSNHAGMFAYIFGGLVLGVLLNLPPRHKWWAPALSALLLADLVFLYGTGSRGAMAGMLFAAGVVIFIAGRRRLLVGAFGVMAMAVGLGLTLAPIVRERIATVFAVLGGEQVELLVGRRLVWWQDALEQYFLSSPVLGSGAQHVLTDSAYVQELCLRGMVGLLLYTALLLVIARAGYVTWRLSAHPLGRALGFAVLFGTLGVLIQGFSIPVLIGSRPAEMYWVLVGTMWLFYPRELVAKPMYVIRSSTAALASSAGEVQSELIVDKLPRDPGTQDQA